MFSFIASLFSSGKSADKAVDGIYNGIDKAIFTDEERKDMDLKVFELKLRFVEATKNQSLSRRVIAITVTVAWVILLITAVIAKGFGSTEFADFCFDTLSENVNTPFGIVVGFYFLTQVFKGAKK